MTARPIHDFRETDAYPLWRGVTAWRWEFLRRNEEYQAAFDLDGGAIPVRGSCLRFGLQSLPDPAMEYDQIQHCFESGGSFGFQLPTLADLEKWKSRPGFNAERVLRSVLWSVEVRQRTGLHFAQLDLSVPLRPQFEKIEMLAQARPKVERMRPEKWRTYLRILDGVAERLSLDEVAAVMYPHERNDYQSGYAPRKKVEQAMARARALCTTFAIRVADPEK